MVGNRTVVVVPGIAYHGAVEEAGIKVLHELVPGHRPGGHAPGLVGEEHSVGGQVGVDIAVKIDQGENFVSIFQSLEGHELAQIWAGGEGRGSGRELRFGQFHRSHFVAPLTAEYALSDEGILLDIGGLILLGRIVQAYLHHSAAARRTVRIILELLVAVHSDFHAEQVDIYGLTGLVVTVKR